MTGTSTLVTVYEIINIKYNRNVNRHSALNTPHILCYEMVNTISSKYQNNRDLSQSNKKYSLKYVQ